MHKKFTPDERCEMLFDLFSILEIEDDMLVIQTFEFVRYESGEDIYPIMRIRAENVTVEEI